MLYKTTIDPSTLELLIRLNKNKKGCQLTAFLILF